METAVDQYFREYSIFHFAVTIIFRKGSILVGRFQRIPKRIHLAAVFFCRTAGTTVPFEEKCFHRSVELVHFGLRGEIVDEPRDGLCPLAFVNEFNDPICVGHRSLAHYNSVAAMNCLGRLHVGSIKTNLASVARICRLAARLVGTY